MAQDSTKRRMPTTRAGLLSLCLAALWGCGDGSSEKLRPIRGHTRLEKGVTHADPAMRAEHYCKSCHGEGLSGGTGFEPSCYTCHGKNWLDEAPGVSLAPEDHTVDHGGYRHHASLLNPEGTCNECHGALLQGDPTLGRPGCELCHERLWQR